ncbi:MAG: nicotinate phosphoribosyltransferase [Armatimonadota bacterium]|nr:nicotinate phosphoribosyltransferase [bacterium]
MRIATWEDIKAGRVTDIYFQRTAEILQALEVHKTVTADVTVSALPDGYDWAILTGVNDVLSLMEGLNVDVDILPEGTFFRRGDPVLEITGDYLDFAVHETAILGFLCQQSGIATKAARCRKAAGDRAVISFGARRMHPTLSPVIDRNAYIGGCDGVSTILAAEIMGIIPSGTMPHALILILGSIAEATKLFDRIIDPRFPRVALVDTLCDEKFESIQAAEAIGDRLWGVRLDTPGSRRGDMARILEEVRWELDIRGFQHVKLIVSGGVDEKEILELNAHADGYGVGTAISNATTINFALDIVDIEGQPFTKRGKRSGRKQILRCESCFESTVVPRSYPEALLDCPCGGKRIELLKPGTRGGKIVMEVDTDSEIRSFVLRQLEQVTL